MKISSMLKESWNYAWKGNSSRWVVLAGFMVIFPLGLGYLVQVLKGTKPAPEPEGFINQLSDGIMLITIIIGDIVLIIMGSILVLFPLMFPLVLIKYLIETPIIDPYLIAGGIIEAISFLIMSTLFMLIGFVRFAHTGLMEEAFEFRVIWKEIKTIGLLKAAVCQVLICAIMIFPLALSVIITAGILIVTNTPMRFSIGIFLIVILSFYPVISVMAARLASLLYNEGRELISDGTKPDQLLLKTIDHQNQLFLPGKKKRWNVLEIRLLVHESWRYAWERFVSHWVVLVAFTVMIPLGLGYLVQVLKGINPAPKPEINGTVLIDGIKLISILTGYFVILLSASIIPFISALIIYFFFYFNITYPESQYYRNFTVASGFVLCLFMLVIPAIPTAIALTLLFLTGSMGITRFAKTRVMREAYNIRKIWDTIHSTGWWQISGAIIVLPVSFLLILKSSGIIPGISGMLITCPVIILITAFCMIFFIYPLIAIMTARIVSILYDKGVTQESKTVRSNHSDQIYWGIKVK